MTWTLGYIISLKSRTHTHFGYVDLFIFNYIVWYKYNNIFVSPIYIDTTNNEESRRTQKSRNS